MQCTILIMLIVLVLVLTVTSLPMEPRLTDANQNDIQRDPRHSLEKRFINPMFAFGGGADSGLVKMRTKRGADEECEKLALCKLHARSQQNFVSAFELYFVNKHNAQLWDHQARSIQDCEARFGDCYDEYE